LRSNSRRITAITVLIGLSFCLGNLWFTAARTAIPLSLDMSVVDKEIRHEKHPGFDDVHLLRASDGSVMVIDGDIYNRIEPGETITKERWDRRMRIGDQSHDLVWSVDVRGMLWAMPITAVALTCVAFFPVRQERREC
jgi:hypothetical protein